MAVKPVPEALDPEGIKRIGELYTNTQEKALYFFLYLTGARITEALNVRARDVTEEDLPEVGSVIRVHMLTLKNKLHKYRDIPIVVSKAEKDMIDYMMWYVTQRQGDVYDPEVKIFTMSRQSAWNKLTRHSIVTRASDGTHVLDEYVVRIRPHYLRHCRATHLVQVHGFSDTELVRYMGWTNSKPAQVYVNLNWMDLAHKMKKEE